MKSEVIVANSPMVPTRVLLNVHGQAGGPEHYPTEKIGVIFVRDDGWSIGAARALRSVAYDLWPDKWVSVYEWNGTGWDLTHSR